MSKDSKNHPDVEFGEDYEEVPYPFHDSPPAAAYSLTSVYVTVFLDSMGAMMVMPLLPYLAREMNGDAFQIGLMQALYSLLQAFGSSVLGILADRVGKRHILLLSLALSSVSLVAFGLASNLNQLLFFRGMNGFFAGTVSVCQAIVADVTLPHERAGKMALIMAAYGVGVVAGPALAGCLSDFGFSIVCFIGAGLTFTNFAVAIFRLPQEDAKPLDHGTLASIKEINEAERSSDAESEDPQTVCDDARDLASVLCADSTLIVVNLVNFLQYAIVGAFLGVVALLAHDRFDISASGLGRIYCAAGVTMVIFQGAITQPAVDAIGESWCIIVGSLARVLGFTLLASRVDAWVAWVSPITIVAAGALIDPCTASMVSKSVKDGSSGTVLGAYSALASLGSFFGPLCSGYLYRELPEEPFWACAIVSAACAIFMLFVFLSRPRHHHAGDLAVAPAEEGEESFSGMHRKMSSFMMTASRSRSHSLALPVSLSTMADPDCAPPPELRGRRRNTSIADMMERNFSLH